MTGPGSLDRRAGAPPLPEQPIPTITKPQSAYQTLAVTTSNGAQERGLMEAVDKSHFAIEVHAGLHEVGDHLFPADAAIPTTSQKKSEAVCLGHIQAS